MLVELERQRAATTPKPVPPKLTLKQSLAVKVRGRAFLRYEKREGWAHPAPIYAAKCDRHGLYEDYPHGWGNELECPICLQERVGIVRLGLAEAHT